MDPMMQAIQLRGKMPKAKRQAEARKVTAEVAEAVRAFSDADLDRADGLLVSIVHAGVRPSELFLEIVAAAVKEA